MIKQIQSRKETSQIVLRLMAICLIVSSCTKTIPFEGLPWEEKEKDVSKTLIDQNSDYIYSSSQQNASRSAGDALPFSSGDNKRVKLELTKDSLRVIEVERDQRFASNTTNNKLVLEIPVEHVQYECKKDRYGECTNTETKSDQIDWKKRDTVRIKLDEVKSGELELLPIISDSTFGGSCYENVSSRLLKSDIDAESINFQIERTFKTKLDCLGDISSLSDATISAVYHYSLVKAKSVLSSDYQTVSYPDGSDDENTFGFFKTQYRVLDVDNNNTNKSSVQIMNRWNPNRKEIVYYLSDEFYKQENKQLKDLTLDTVLNINKGLEEAGVKFRIKIDEAKGKVPGDIRNSMIVLVEDPVASSVIGYGPQTEDPVTGEIISARTIMFLGTIKKYIKYTYDEIVREKKYELANVKKQGVDFSLSPSIIQRFTSLKNTGKVFGASDMFDKILAQTSDEKSIQSNQHEKSKPIESLNAIAHANLSRVSADKISKDLRNYTSRKNNDYDYVMNDSKSALKAKMKYQQEAKNCAFAPAFDGVASGISQKLKNKFPDNPKPWSELSSQEKEQVISLILPEIWVPTLIHEMGHNLGLRHNFAASEDKDNFLSTDELLKNGIDHQIPFSSVMDYGNDLKTLPVLGKYDIAALRFGYLRQVTVVSGSTEEVVEVPSTLQELNKDLVRQNKELKAFRYCTDEHTGQNAGCKRFDLGTSYTEIVKNMIQDYQEAYETRNLRDGRASFSEMDDLTYMSRVSGIFRELRIMMEVVERIKYTYNLPDNSEHWVKNEFLKDLRQAALLGGSFLTNILLVPDVQCAVAKASQPSEVIAVIPMLDYNPDAINCSDVKLKPEFLIVGQGGKSFNSIKDPESSSADELAVRGYWLDKVAALKTLTTRTIDLPTMNKNTDSFLNMSELREGILSVLNGVVANNVVNKVPFKMIDGSIAQFEIGFDLDSNHTIKQPLLVDAINRIPLKEVRDGYLSRLGVNSSGKTPFKQIVSRVVSRNMFDPNREHDEDLAIFDRFTVYRFDDIHDIKINKSAKSVVINGTRYVADVKNAVAREAMTLLPMVHLLDQLEFEKIAVVLQHKSKKVSLPPPASQSEKDKAEHALMKEIYNKVSAEVMTDYLNGIVKSEAFYTDLLENLASAH